MARMQGVRMQEYQGPFGIWKFPILNFLIEELEEPSHTGLLPRVRSRLGLNLLASLS